MPTVITRSVGTGTYIKSWVSRVNYFLPSRQLYVEAIKRVLEQLTAEKIISLSSYDFILEALFRAASN
jgi:hypothetical protein